VTIKIGLMGCGSIAQQVHLPVLAALPGVAVVALADSDERQRNKAAALAPGAKLFADTQTLLEQGGAEAVIIALPSSLHTEAAVSALSRKKNVFIEKPLATTLADGQRILAAWQGSGLVGMTGFNYRFNPLYQSVKQHLDSGRLGRLLHARTVFTTPPAAVNGAATWRQTKAGGGSALLDLGSHHIDLLHYFFGEPVREVSASIISTAHPEDTTSLEITMNSGLTVQSFFSTSAGDVDMIEIYGERGLLQVDRYLSLNVTVTDYPARLSRGGQVARTLGSLQHAPYLLEKMRAANHEPSYKHILEQFINAIQQNKSVPPTLEDGYRCLQVVAAAQESARAGQRVTL
jgi:predicted dehydrogenase